MTDFDLLKVKVKKRFFFYRRKGTSSHQTASFEILRMKIGSAVWAVPASKSVETVETKKKRKNAQIPYMLGICTSVPEYFSETKFCLTIKVDDVINHTIFFNQFTRVSLARGQTSPFSVQTVDSHYNKCTTAQL